MDVCGLLIFIHTHAKLESGIFQDFKRAAKNNDLDFEYQFEFLIFYCFMMKRILVCAKCLHIWMHRVRHMRWLTLPSDKNRVIWYNYYHPQPETSTTTDRHNICTFLLQTTIVLSLENNLRSTFCLELL